MDKHVNQSGKRLGVGSHHNLPTGMLKAKTFLRDEYLHDIETAHDQRYFYYRAKCFHSFKKKERPHRLKLALCIVSGKVEHAYCGPTCAAGKSGFCNHILALMLKICKFSLYDCETVSELKMEDDENPSSSCTSTLQKWHKPRVEGISAQPVMEVAVVKTHEKEKKTEGIQCKLYEARKVSSSKIEQFFEKIKSVDPTLGLLQTCELKDNVEQVNTKFGESPLGSFGSYRLTFTESNFKVMSPFQPNPNPNPETTSSFPSLPLDDPNLDVLPLPDNLDEEKSGFLEKLQLSLIYANKLEQKTKQQHGSEKWVQERKFRFTASRFGEIVRRRKNFTKYFQEQMNAKTIKSRSMDHGIRYEPVAKREYVKYMNRIGHPVTVLDSGLFVSPKLYVLGCSPDGKVIDHTAESNEDKFGLLEIKCPSSKFSVTPEDSCSDTSFYLEMKGSQPKLKTNHVYHDQVQGQMGITGAKWCDFVVYTSVGMSIERIPFNQAHWEQLRNKLCERYFTYFLPLAATS